MAYEDQLPSPEAARSDELTLRGLAGLDTNTYFDLIARLAGLGLEVVPAGLANEIAEHEPLPTGDVTGATPPTDATQVEAVVVHTMPAGEVIAASDCYGSYEDLRKFAELRGYGAESDLPGLLFRLVGRYDKKIVPNVDLYHPTDLTAAAASESEEPQLHLAVYCSAARMVDDLRYAGVRLDLPNLEYMMRHWLALGSGADRPRGAGDKTLGLLADFINHKLRLENPLPLLYNPNEDQTRIHDRKPLLRSLIVDGRECPVVSPDFVRDYLIDNNIAGRRNVNRIYAVFEGMARQLTGHSYRVGEPVEYPQELRGGVFVAGVRRYDGTQIPVFAIEPQTFINLIDRLNSETLEISGYGERIGGLLNVYARELRTWLETHPAIAAEEDASAVGSDSAAKRAVTHLAEGTKSPHEEQDPSGEVGRARAAVRALARWLNIIQ